MNSDSGRPPRRRWWRWVRRLLALVAVLVCVALIALWLQVRSIANDQTIHLAAAGFPQPVTSEPSSSGRALHYLRWSATQAGQVRPVVIAMPDQRPAGARLPVVIVLHGLDGNVGTIPGVTGWTDAALAHQLIAVYPQGAFNSWNADGCCRPAITTDMDDVAFLDTVVNDLVARPEVDPQRIYMVGQSNGGMMAYRYACFHADRLAGVASVTGTKMTDCDPSRPIDLFQVAVRDDQVVKYDGGNSVISFMYASEAVPPVDVSMARMAQHFGCQPEPVAVTNGGERRVWSQCRDGRTVTLDTRTTGHHNWPRGSAYDATQQIIERFKLNSG